MGNLVQRVYLFAKIAKLIAYFLIYQFIFIVAGQFVAYLCYRSSVQDISYSLFMQMPDAVIERFNTNGVAVGMFLSSLAMIVHLLAFKYVRINKGFLHEVRRDVLLFSTLFIGCVMMIFNIVAVWLGLENNMETTIEGMMGNYAGIISMAVLAPVVEELLFRGAIQGTMMRFFGNPWVGIIIASLLFGLIHANPIQMFYASCLGVAFGWVYYRTGSLLPAIVGHIVNNSLAVVSLLLYGPDVVEDEVAASLNMDVTMVVVGVIFATVFALVINKSQPRVPSPWHEASEVL